MSMLKLNIGAMLILLVSHTVHAQTPTPPLVDESELRTCLQLEQQGLKRFNTLEQRASDLRGGEKLLNERRVALRNQQTNLNTGKPDKNAVDGFNEDVNTFNLQADQLNADKAVFENDSRSYDD